MDNSFSSLIDSATSVLVLLPTKPTFDQVAAALSLYFSIKEKKEVHISCPSQMMVGFSRIVGVDRISPELGSKNLTIKFKDYDANNIEKVSYDIVGGEFNLTVVPKIGFSSPQKEQIDLSLSGISADLVILVGGANDSHFPAVSSGEITGAKIVHIGNRVLSTNCEIMSLAAKGATISEIVADILRSNEMAVDPDTATNLVMGIEEGSSNFSSPDVTAETFETFAFLLRMGGQRQPRVKLSSANFPPGSIPTQPLDIPLKSEQQVKILEQALEQVGNKEEVVENPPEDWLQAPKVFKGSSVPQSQSQPDSFSENKG